MRVKVFDGTGERYLGQGDYLGTTTVYVIVMPDGSLRSMKNAEEPPPESEVPEGAIVKKIQNNPKIQMDNGDVKYGCQVWWEPLKQVVEVTGEGEPDYDPWA